MSPLDPRTLAGLRSRVPSRDEPEGGVRLVLDGSPAGRAPLRWAAAEASVRGTTLRIERTVATPVPVVDPWTPWVGWHPWVAPEGPSATELAWTTARSDVARAIRQAHAVDPRLDVSTSLAAGSVAAALARRAADDVLVVVARRRGLWPLLGHLPGANGVRRPRCPVAVVRLTDVPQPGPSAHRVVAALRPREVPTDVLDVAFRAAARRRTGLTVLHARGGAASATVATEILDEVLDPYGLVFPDVEVRTREVPSLARAVASESRGAAAVVVGLPSAARDVAGRVLVRRVLGSARSTVVCVPSARPVPRRWRS